MQIDACVAQDSCYDCLVGTQSGPVCDYNSAFQDVSVCFDNYCATQCM